MTNGGRSCLASDLVAFEYESFPSERTDEYVARTRFPTKECAYYWLTKYWELWKRVGPGWLRVKDAEKLVPPL